MKTKASRASHSIQRYGYTRLEGQIVKDPTEYKTVIQILKLWRSGKSLTAIAKHLNGNNVSPRRGKRWHHETVQQIIKHETKHKE
ncbi:MAG: recombinase family protein [Bdellovibrionales bacterium]